jgi:hypothetical protein
MESMGGVQLLTCGTEGHLPPTMISATNRFSRQGQQGKLQGYVSGTFKQPGISRTVGHAQTHVVERLPVCKRLLHSTVTVIILERVVVILEEVSDKELGLALCT